MEEVRLIHSVDKPNNLRSIIKQDLREHGIKVPKEKKSKKLNQLRNLSQDGTLSSSIFGNYLSLVPSKYVADCGFVPTFLVEAAELIQQHCNVEGIFRKSGSISRQKELKQQIEDGQRLQSENVHDMTGVVKQFFRELPEPLLTSVFHDSFVRCYQLDPARQVEAMLLLCLMLPMEHLSTLRFTMKLLSRLAAHSSDNKMDVGNLAVVVAPNIMHVNSRSQKMNAIEEKLLQIQTAIVELLIHNAESIGVVSDSLSERTALMTEYFGTEDELDASDDNALEDSKDCKEIRKKARKRSNSLQGIVNTIGRGIAKLRRSTDGKNTSASGSNSCVDIEAPSTFQSASLALSQPQGDVSLLTKDQLLATPVVKRKRRMSGETVPFSATKRKAILEQLPQKSALGATPFTPASKKRHQFDKSQVVPDATPREDTNTSLRKKINLFSPAGSRKSKRCKSGVGSCSGGLRKSGRTKHLFRRISGGKGRGDDGGDEDTATSPSRVPQSQSAMELSVTERSPLALTRTVSSPSLHNDSSHSPDDLNALNQGFIDPDSTAPLDATTFQAGPKERGRTLRHPDSFNPGQKPVRRSASTDATLRRGQPNKLSSGLLEGKAENVKKLRRSFDKSDISHPIPITVRTLPDKKYTVDVEKGPCLSVRSATETPQPVVPTVVSEKASSVVRNEGKPQASTYTSKSSARQGERGVDMESSLLNVVLPPPAGFTDQTMMEVDSEKRDDMEGSDNESETGFSTISGGTVIHKPPAHLHSLQAGQAGTSATMVHYGSSVSVTALQAPPSLQPSVSVDSLISTESESSEAGVDSHSRVLDRSTSLDSGKGSLVDNAESGFSRRLPNKTDVKSSDLKTARIKLEGNTVSSIKNLPIHIGTTHSLKSLSAEDLKTMKKLEKPPTRSQSMYVGGCSHHPNIIPNLQISAETHRLLTRAGFLETSLPPHVKDAAVPIRSPQKMESVRESFRRDQRHTCSFRLEKSATFRKDRSSILFADHPTPVKEEASMKHTEIKKGSVHAMDIEQEHEPFEKDKLIMRELTDSSTSECIADKNKEDELEKMECLAPEPAKDRTEERAEEVRPSAISLKRAELRLPKHDSVLNIKEKNAGRVAQSVQQINCSLDQSLDQANTSLHFQKCTSRKRGVSPIRIPTIFAKSKAEPSSAYYQELAQKYHRKAGHPDVIVEHADRREDDDERTTEEQTFADHSDDNQVVKSHNVEQGTAKESSSPRRRESTHTSLGTGSMDLSSSLMETIEEMTIARRQRRPASGQPADVSRFPLQESTNMARSSLSGDSVQLRTSKGLTPHQVVKYGTKVAGSDRSPGKPVKRLQSPYGRQSPQKAREGDYRCMESHHFHEHY